MRVPSDHTGKPAANRCRPPSTTGLAPLSTGLIVTGTLRPTKRPASRSASSSLSLAQETVSKTMQGGALTV